MLINQAKISTTLRIAPISGMTNANKRQPKGGIAMDYSKSGTAKLPKNAPKHSEHNAKGTDKNPFGSRATKAELLARMKAAAEAKKNA